MTLVDNRGQIRGRGPFQSRGRGQSCFFGSRDHVPGNGIPLQRQTTPIFQDTTNPLSDRIVSCVLYFMYIFAFVVVLHLCCILPIIG